MTDNERLTAALEDAADSIALRLAHSSTPQNVRALAAAARALTLDHDLGPVLRISPVVPLRDGPLFRIDDLPDDDALRARLLEVVANAVTDANRPVTELRALPVDGLVALDNCRRAVVLRLFPVPRGESGVLPAAWIDLAAEWVFGDVDPDTPVQMRVLGVEVSATTRDAVETMHRCAEARTWCDVVSGDLGARIRTASLSFGIAPHVAIAAGGPRCDRRGLLARFDLLGEVARHHGSGSYACIDFEETFALLGLGFPESEWAEAGGASPNRVAGRLVDRYVPDGFPVQILGPRHAAALGDQPGLRPLGNGRFELTIGAPEDWLNDAPDRSESRAAAWAQLRPLLLEDADLDDAITAAGPVGPPAEQGPGTEDDGHGPDLDSVVIESHPHPRRGASLTILELAAWIAGERHTDAPRSVSAVISDYVRELAAGVDEEFRPRLVPLARTLVGTAPASARLEEARCWVLADHLLRVQAPAWLALSGLREAAIRLRSLGPAYQDTDLVRGVDLVARSITNASRRLDTALDLAGPRREEIDQIAWEVWEDVSTRSGWAAAAGAVTDGMPGDLTFATDQRAMECARDAGQRRELEKARRSLADELWSTALHEVARLAWAAAWDRAEEIVQHDSRFSFRSTLRRTLMTALDDPGGVTVDMVLDDVESTARARIARLILVGDTTSDYWIRGIDAANEAEGGNFWRKAFEDTRTLLGPSLFDDATGAARTELARWAERANGLVSRAVVAAITREVCSLSGRGAAARAAADAVARGRPLDDAQVAARAVFDRAVSVLAAEGLTVVETMAGLSA